MHAVSGFYHDAALLWALSRNKTVMEQVHPSAIPDGQEIAKNTRNFRFDGKEWGGLESSQLR